MLRLRVRRCFLLACPHCCTSIRGGGRSGVPQEGLCNHSPLGEGAMLAVVAAAPLRSIGSRPSDQSSSPRALPSPLAEAAMYSYTYSYRVESLLPSTSGGNKTKRPAACWLCVAKGRSLCAVFPSIYSQPSTLFLPESGMTRARRVWTRPPLLLLLLLLLSCY